jgi:hypothetical protein
MKKDAEEYLKATYKSDGSPKVRHATVLVAPTPVERGGSSTSATTLLAPPKIVKKKVHTDYFFLKCFLMIVLLYDD